jgi:hypothetical protein
MILEMRPQLGMPGKGVCRNGIRTAADVPTVAEAICVHSLCSRDPYFAMSIRQFLENRDDTLCHLSSILEPSTLVEA